MYCDVCRDGGGTLVLCDGCPKSYHPRHLKKFRRPDMSSEDTPFYCPDCSEEGNRSAPANITHVSLGTELNTSVVRRSGRKRQKTSKLSAQRPSQGSDIISDVADADDARDQSQQQNKLIPSTQSGETEWWNIVGSRTMQDTNPVESTRSGAESPSCAIPDL